MAIEKYFPYDSFRPYQRELAEAIYEGLKAGRAVLANAPTGLGKTAAALAAALAYSEEAGAPIAYLVRTKNEMLQPLAELGRLRARGLELKYAFLRNKQDMCCYRELRGLPYAEFLAECRYLRALGKCKYYPPKPVKIEGSITPKSFIKASCEAGACAYEVAKAEALWAQVVVATYFYAFNVRGEPRLDPSRYVLIVDEAHSLPDSVNAINSLVVSEAEIRRARADAERYGLAEAAASLYKAYAALQRMRLGPLSIGDVLALFDEPSEIERAAAEAIKRRIDEGVHPYTPLVAVAELIEALRGPARYWVYLAEGGEGGRELRAVPADVMPIISRTLAAAKGAVLLSGSLPIELFSKSLSLPAAPMVFDIPFDKFVEPGNYISVVDRSVTTRYTARGEETYKAIAKRLAAAVAASPRGVLAVFPSYDLLKAVRKYLALNIPYLVEARDTDLEGVELGEKFLVFAVAGGKLAEGVEYIRGGENLLSTIVVVGVPYPEPDPYLDKRVEELRPSLGQSAWDAVYLYNAVVKVRQAVGRLFRRPGDRGALVFLDERFLSPEVYSQLKDMLRGAKIVADEAELGAALEEFFEGLLPARGEEGAPQDEERYG
ncbi:MAG: ATP-dependent DNA helicase [Thermoproteus sp. AZ2]|jgi:DNA excision repair protein ERCC-2|uniref:ATP-dependent DNA helicase n=1 Tax=Thermoproteus sp. AZ2 TaxID=1609232 RepID=A0ACC6UZQ6_9CREN